MRKIILLMLLMAALSVEAQDIQITRFERCVTCLQASMNQEYDNTGEVCALLRFFVRDKGFIIEPNMGIVRQEYKSGEIDLWVPKGTKRLTIRHEGQMPLTGYEIPVAIESKVTYDVELEIAKKESGHNKGHNVYGGLGFNVVSIMGPSVALGFNVKQHNIELGAVFGLNKTDDIYFYDSSSSVTAAYNYQAIRVQLRYGYDIEVTDFFSIMPEAGLAYNLYNGKEVVKGKSDYGSANSMSTLVGVRLVASFNEHFKMHLTPEYDFGIYKDDNCKKLSDFDSTFKSWTDGFNLNIGLMYIF